MKYTKRQILEAVSYWKKQLRRMDEAEIVVRGPEATGADVKKFTKRELDWIIARTGETGDFQAAGWILPDGRMPDMKRTQETYWKNDELYDYATKRPVDNERYEHDCLPMPPARYRDVERLDMLPMEYLLSAGFVRIDGSESASVHVYSTPTPAQMDRLYDFVDQPWGEMRDIYRHRKGIAHFALDAGDVSIVYDDIDDFRKRLMNDIRNYT